jgi:hypothetical protein
MAKKLNTAINNWPNCRALLCQAARCQYQKYEGRIGLKVSSLPESNDLRSSKASPSPELPAAPVFGTFKNGQLAEPTLKRKADEEEGAELIMKRSLPEHLGEPFLKHKAEEGKLSLLPSASSVFHQEKTSHNLLSIPNHSRPINSSREQSNPRL